MISIIVPLYNVEKTICCCIESIVSQSFENIEIILVNDASSDDSINKCEKYVSKDRRIKILNKLKNEGVEMARLTGIQCVSSQSKYVMFVDADDWIQPGILQRCYDVAESTEVDYVQFRSRRVISKLGISIGESERFIVDNKRNIKTLGEKDGLFEDYFLSFFGVNILPVTLWGKLYRTDLLKRKPFSPCGLSWGEDLIMNMRLFPYVEKIAFIDDIGYNYRVGGMTSHALPHLLPVAMKMFLLKEEAIKKYDYDKATFFARVEMKNILRTAISQRIEYKYGTVADNKKWVAEMLSDPMWDRISEIVNDSRCADDPFVQAMARRDVDELWRLMALTVKPHGLKWRVKQLALKFLS